ncbi:Flp pilus assembly protein CpaB [Chloroflexota bacterium]
MGRLRGCLWLTAGLVVAVLAGGVAFISLQRATSARTVDEIDTSLLVPVVVASQNIGVRSQLTTSNLEEIEVPVDTTPEGAIGSLDEALGKITLVDLYPGEIILAQRLLDPNIITGDGRLALVVADGEVLMAFPAQDLMSRIPVLKPGDHVDLLFTLNFILEGEGAEADEEQVTFDMLQNVTIAALVGAQNDDGTVEGQPEAILLTVSPQDALHLKYAKDAGGIVDIVLRPPGIEQPYSVEPVDADYMIRKYGIPIGQGR